MWVPDLFMERVSADGMWSLMCPDECPGLADCWGEEFKELYERWVLAVLLPTYLTAGPVPRYEREGRARSTVRAQKLWFAVLEAQTETGTPYMVFKDASNRKSNQQVSIAYVTNHTHYYYYYYYYYYYRILVQSSVATCAQRSSSTPVLMR